MPEVARMGDSWSCGDTQCQSSGDVFVNGRGVARLGDLTCGHCFSPVPIVESSGDVFVNGRGMARLGDAHPGHSCPPASHGGTLSTGSSDTFCNGL